MCVMKGLEARQHPGDDFPRSSEENRNKVEVKASVQVQVYQDAQAQDDVEVDVCVTAYLFVNMILISTLDLSTNSSDAWRPGSDTVHQTTDPSLLRIDSSASAPETRCNYPF